MKSFISTVVLFSLLSTTPVFANARDRAEISRDKQELSRNAAERREDRQDLRRLERTLMRFDGARRSHSFGLLDTIDLEVRDILAKELGEGHAEMNAARTEAVRSDREVGSAKREVRDDVRQGNGPVATADDRRDLRDDRADRQDDARDLALEQGQQSRKRAIARDWARLIRRHDPAALTVKRELIVQLIGLAKEEALQNRTERAEDKRELREDKRELREGVRQGQ